MQTSVIHFMIGRHSLQVSCVTELSRSAKVLRHPQQQQQQQQTTRAPAEEPLALALVLALAPQSRPVPA